MPIVDNLSVDGMMVVDEFDTVYRIQTVYIGQVDVNRGLMVPGRPFGRPAVVVIAIAPVSLKKNEVF